jgi:hypothetical protein
MRRSDTPTDIHRKSIMRRIVCRLLPKLVKVLEFANLFYALAVLYAYGILTTIGILR